jgi:hypothetical protein
MLEESADVVITTTSAANRIIRARFKSRCNGRGKALGELHNRSLLYAGHSGCHGDGSRWLRHGWLKTDAPQRHSARGKRDFLLVECDWVNGPARWVGLIESACTVHVCASVNHEAVMLSRASRTQETIQPIRLNKPEERLFGIC